MAQEVQELDFLKSGGEMGKLIRSKDWTATSLGPPDAWPRSLQMAISMLLNAAFPMFIWWGEDHIQFYNDGYRPSLGTDGKHPAALGQPGQEYWPEIWPIVKPLLDQVLGGGEALWREDQLIPIFRNGKLEDVYWTFSYSPIRKEEGDIGGVLVVCNETTENILNRQKLLDSEKNLRNTILKAPVAICIFRGEELVIEEANERMFKFWGKTSEQVMHKPLFEAIPEAINQGYEEMLGDVFKTGKPFSAMELPVNLPRNGKVQTVYINFSYDPIFEADRTISGIMAMAVDVTEQVLARRKVEESEQKYRTLFESMDQGFTIIEVIFDAGNRPVDYRFLDVNPVFEKQTGLKDAVGKTALQLVPDLESHWFERYGNVVLTGEPHRFNEGSAVMGRWFEIYAFKMGGKHSRKVAILFTDITESKKAEAAIRKSESNLRNMILQSPVAMCILNGPSFIVEVANERILELWGKQAEEVMHKPVFEGVIEAREQGLEHLMHNVYTTGERFIASERPITFFRNGKVELTYINFVYEPFFGTDGSVTGIMAVAIEVTGQVLARQKIEETVIERTRELAEANEALLISNQELKRSNASLEEFTHAASHDLKEPTRKIQVFMQRLKSSMALQMSETEKQLCERIEIAANRMNTLIDDLLTFSEVSQKSKLDELIDMNQLIDQVLKDLDLEIELKGAIIKTGKLFSIKGHRSQLQQAFFNLISNALKYSKADVAPVIEIKGSISEGQHAGSPLPAKEQAKAYYRITVKDNGIGFEQEYAERIFKMFTRLHGVAEYKGTGVGLSIVRKVIENHNGYIWADSTVGEGATFKMLLPADQGTFQ